MILVPVLTVLLRFPVKTALGTSLAVVAAQAIPGTVTHAIIGNIDWAIAGGLVIGVIPGARIGSRMAVAAEDRKLRTVVAIAMALLAIAFAVTEIRALDHDHAMDGSHGMRCHRCRYRCRRKRSDRSGLASSRRCASRNNRSAIEARRETSKLGSRATHRSSRRLGELAGAGRRAPDQPGRESRPVR